MRGVTANKVADYFLWLAHEKGDLLTNLKLQKLLYYAQAWFLALYNRPLFNDNFQAWVHGPAHYGLYKRFQQYSWNPISENPSEPVLPEEVKLHLQEVMEVFGDYSAFTLERMVHSEDPWKNARQGLAPDKPSRAVIDKEDMKKYYRRLSESE